MHAGFGAQEAVGIVALDLDRGAADAGHVAVGLLQQFGLEALALAVLEVLAQQHAGPVAGFGAAGAGLDVDEAVVGVGRVVEHAAEFEVGDQLLRRVEVAFDRNQGVFVVFVARQLEQVAGIDPRRADAGQRADHGFEGFFLACPGPGRARHRPRAWGLRGSGSVRRAFPLCRRSQRYLRSCSPRPERSAIRLATALMRSASMTVPAHGESWRLYAPTPGFAPVGIARECGTCRNACASLMSFRSRTMPCPK
jgi:hypothetical protein